jgi:hypothetical protein
MNQDNNESEQKTERKEDERWIRKAQRVGTQKERNDAKHFRKSRKSQKGGNEHKKWKKSNSTKDQKRQNSQSPQRRQQRKNKEEPKMENQIQQKARNSSPARVRCSTAENCSEKGN